MQDTSGQSNSASYYLLYLSTTISLSAIYAVYRASLIKTDARFFLFLFLPPYSTRGSKPLSEHFLSGVNNGEAQTCNDVLQHLCTLQNTRKKPNSQSLHSSVQHSQILSTANKSPNHRLVIVNQLSSDITAKQKGSAITNISP